MSGPIVRSGPSPEFSKNWDSVFSGKSKAKATTKSIATPKKEPKLGLSSKAKAKAAAKTEKPAKKAAKKTKKKAVK